MRATESLLDGDSSCYRIDLKLGISHSKIPGALERWVGDSGLCRDPDNHPYMVLAEISSCEWGGKQDVMQTIARCVAEAGPIMVSVNPLPNAIPLKDFSSYQVRPSPGLYSFVLHLFQACPVIFRPGSFIESMARGAPATLPVVLPNLYSHMVPQSGDFVRDEGHPPGTGPKIESRTRSGFYRKDGQDSPVFIEILRIVLRKKGIPIAEYDTSMESWFSSSESTRRKNARQSLRAFRMRKGYQLTGSRYCPNPQVYVISDLHLGHANSIPRYKRPFLISDPGEMDRVLIRNWNWTVKDNDIAIFLGDLSYMSKKLPESYLERLQGRIFYLEGNHDPFASLMSHCLLMRYRGIPYLFIHNPDELVKPFDGWVIHGHVHNKDLTNYPFFNPHSRTVNVSAEMIGYRPISLPEIHHLVTGTDEVIPFRDLSWVDVLSRDVPPEPERALASVG